MKVSPFLVCAIAWISLSALAEGSLEVKLAEPTPDGPRLEWTDGCYVYGSLIAAVAQGHEQGVPISYYLGLASTGVEKVAGMKDFLQKEVLYVYGFPPVHRNYAVVRREAIAMCREANGKTWQFRKSF